MRTSFAPRPSLLRAAMLALAFGVSSSSAAAPRLDLSRLRSPYDGGQGRRTLGVAQTSLERDLARPGSKASVGFLCGLQPAAVASGGAAAYGVDPQGRFLGAQLKFGFR